MLDTEVGQAVKGDLQDVAKVGFDAMMDGEGDVVAGWKQVSSRHGECHALCNARRAARQNRRPWNGQQT